MSLFTGMEAWVCLKDNLDNFLGHCTSARFSTCMSSINAQPIQAMYLPSQVHGNRLRFMFGIEVEFEGHGRQGLRLCYIGCSAVCYSQMFIVKPLRRHIHNCPFQFCHLELKISRLHDFGHHFFVHEYMWIWLYNTNLPAASPWIS